MPERAKYGVNPFHRLAKPSAFTTYDNVCTVDLYFSGAPSVLGGWLCIRVLAESCRRLRQVWSKRERRYGVSGVDISVLACSARVAAKSLVVGQGQAMKSGYTRFFAGCRCPPVWRPSVDRLLFRVSCYSAIEMLCRNDVLSEAKAGRELAAAAAAAVAGTKLKHD